MNSLLDITNVLEPRVIKAILSCRDLLCSTYSHLEPEIVLYGSQARGTADPESDIDLLILVNQPVTRDIKRAIFDDIFEIDLECDVVVSPLIQSREQWNRPTVKILSIYQNVQKEGVKVA